MRTIFRYMLMSLAGLSAASLALAQHEGHQMPGQSSGQLKADRRVTASLSEIERLNLVIENARQGNDPAKMRAAIDELQNSLAAIRANLLAVPPPETAPMTMPSSRGAMDHSKMSMPGMASPSGKTKEMDHSKMSMPGMAPPSGKTKEMDHSKMDMPGMAPSSKSPPPSGKTKDMDHSKMDMSGKDSAGGKAMSQETPQANTKDPVCGMEVGTQAAEKATYQGKTYYFCSRADREKFLSDPAKYVNR